MLLLLLSHLLLCKVDGFIVRNGRGAVRAITTGRSTSPARGAHSIVLTASNLALAGTRANVGAVLNEPSTVVERPSTVGIGSMVEYCHDGHVRVASVVGAGAKQRNTVLLRQPDGTTLTTPSEQIISVWGDGEVAERSWDNIRQDAAGLLNSTVPRKQDLEEFWEIVGQQRGHRLVVDSLDVGVYLFQEGHLRAWLNPYQSGDAAGVRPLAAAQRYAAALMLHNDGTRFKRRPSTLAAPEGATKEDVSGRPLSVVEGGYRVLREGVVLHKQSTLFEQYYTEQLCNLTHLQGQTDRSQYPARTAMLENIAAHRAAGKNSVSERPAAASTISRILRHLELYALSGQPAWCPRPAYHRDVDKKGTRGNVPGTVNAPKLVAAVLKRLNVLVSPAGARRVLLSLNQGVTLGYTIEWRKDTVPEEGVGGTGRSSPPSLVQVPVTTAESTQLESPAAGLSTYTHGTGSDLANIVASSASSSTATATNVPHAEQNSLAPWSPAVLEATRHLTRMAERDQRRYSNTGKCPPMGLVMPRALYNVE
jgi:hypothetical protein